MTRSPTPGCLVRAAIARFHLNKLIKGPALGIILRGQSLFLPQVGLNVFERNPLCLDGSGRFSCIKSAASYGVHGACSRGELGQDYVGRGATYLRDLERSEGWTGGPSPKLCLTRLMSALFVYNRRVLVVHILLQACFAFVFGSPPMVAAGAHQRLEMNGDSCFRKELLIHVKVVPKI